MKHKQMEFPWETWETFAKAVIRVQLPLMIPETCQEFNRPMPTQQPLFEELAYVDP
jgi:hypothetical protein